MIRLVDLAVVLQRSSRPSRRPIVRVLLAALCLSAVGWTTESPDGPAPSAPTTEQIVARMMEMDRAVTPKLHDYTSVRRYHLENKRFGKKADMTVLVTFRYPGHKEFQVLDEKGSVIIRKKVFRRLLDTELDASRDELRAATQITPDNYSFRLLGSEEVGGRKSYILEANPKRKEAYLFRGKVWMDAEDYAITGVEAAPAVNPSFLIRKAFFVHRYAKFGPFWLAASNRSESDSWIFGRTEVTIDYSDYRINLDSAVSDSKSSH